mmetsp:Transcript_14152/g.26761  ORF Transcript_14152/g.26761 Transcript_14152/m.26761 type:complete len:214 (+) Transcript_14152:969-1610(+)
MGSRGFPRFGALSPAQIRQQGSGTSMGRKTTTGILVPVLGSQLLTRRTNEPCGQQSVEMRRAHGMPANFFYIVFGSRSHLALCQMTQAYLGRHDGTPSLGCRSWRPSSSLLGGGIQRLSLLASTKTHVDVRCICGVSLLWVASAGCAGSSSLSSYKKSLLFGHFELCIPPYLGWRCSHRNESEATTWRTPARSAASQCLCRAVAQEDSCQSLD